MHSHHSVTPAYSRHMECVQPSPNLSPAVCRAGYFQFSAKRIVRSSCIQSRALYWCKSGCGKVSVNGVTHPLEPQDLYVLPWNRSIAHIPDAETPMFTGHVHIVPDYRPGAEWIPNVPHEPNHLSFNSPDRSDALWPGFKDTVRLKIRTDEPIGLLLDYTIRWYIRTHGSDEKEARHLGHLIARELHRKRLDTVDTHSDYPEELRRMLNYVQKSFHLSPTVSELAKMIGRSRSHVLKLFSSNIGTSPKNYIVDCQLREARELLLSTTLRVAEIGQAVGLSDPYHFSKLFRRHVGIPPSEFRRRHGPFSSTPSVPASS